MEKSDTNGGQSAINITVRFAGRLIPLSVSPDSTVEDLKSLLQPITDVLPRGQRLICKGKLLVDTKTMRESEVKDGAKIMLMASQGLHQGGGPVLNVAKSRPISRASVSTKSEENKPGFHIDKYRIERWKATGVIALAQCNLKSIPEELWDCGVIPRVLTISGNLIREVPTRIGHFSSLQRLDLDANSLSDESIQWDGLTSLKCLTVLSLSHNNLTTLPPALGSLSSLKQLYVFNNKLKSFPDEIGLLTQLMVLKAQNNRLISVPASIGNCVSLAEVYLSSNLLSELPETFSHLHDLKMIYLNNNGLKTLPSALFKMCSKLSHLNLHNTEITMDFLRQCDGWDNFDQRRCLTHQKQLDFRVLGSGDFDEGADKRW